MRSCDLSKHCSTDRYDGEGRGYLTCAAFLEKLGVDPQEVGHARKDADTTPRDCLPAGATLQDVE